MTDKERCQLHHGGKSDSDLVFARCEFGVFFFQIDRALNSGIVDQNVEIGKPEQYFRCPASPTSQDSTVISGYSFFSRAAFFLLRPHTITLLCAR
jgi:hypothetical protein